MEKTVLEQWKLTRCGLSEEKMPPDQQREMKRAFFGAWGQLLIYFSDDLPVENEEAAAKHMCDMLDEVEQFWVVENIAQNAINATKTPENLDKDGFFFINPYAYTGGAQGAVMLCRMNSQSRYAEFCYFVKGEWKPAKRVGQKQINEAARFRVTAKMEAMLRQEMP